MKLRDALLNLAITATLILVMVLVAVVLKRSRPEVPRAVPVSAADLTGIDFGSRPVREEFLAITNASLIETRANEADTLRMRVDGEELIFVLYFVDALEATWTHPQRINEQARWFGDVPSEVVVEMGEEALGYVRALLNSKPFRVLTRWERVPNTSRYYALIAVETRPGQLVYLADLLVREGYARIHGVTSKLPGDMRSEAQYLAELRTLSKYAREQRSGIWARSP